MIDDLADPVARLVSMQKRLERTGVVAGGDGLHLGAGAFSVKLGDAAYADGDYSVAIGQNAGADYYGTGLGPSAYAGASSVAIGDSAAASGDDAVAIGKAATAAHFLEAVAIGHAATAEADHEFVLGNANHIVKVPGTFSAPSARRLKQNIVPAPALSSIFPELVEYEYIASDGRRRLGYIADDLIGTDAERFVTYDDEGRPSGIDYLTLLIAQNAQLQARLTELESNRSTDG